MAAALVVLAAIVAVLGPTITLLPLTALRLVVGALLAIFGLQWLRKAILRATGYKSLHDEASAYLREVAAAKAAATSSRGRVHDWYAFTLSFKGVLLEGLEVVFIVITFGANQRNVGAAVIGAAAAVVVVAVTGVAGAGTAGEGAGERDEVRGGHHAHLVRHLLGRRGRRASPGPARTRPCSCWCRSWRWSRSCYTVLLRPAAGGPARVRAHVRGGDQLVRRLRSIGAFWYDFVVGDDWRVAVVVVAALALTAVLVHAAGVNAWWLLPVCVFAALGWSLRRATSGR